MEREWIEEGGEGTTRGGRAARERRGFNVESRVEWELDGVNAPDFMFNFNNATAVFHAPRRGVAAGSMPVSLCNSGGTRTRFGQRGKK